MGVVTFIDDSAISVTMITMPSGIGDAAIVISHGKEVAVVPRAKECSKLLLAQFRRVLPFGSNIGVPVKASAIFANREGEGRTASVTTSLNIFQGDAIQVGRIRRC